MLCRLLPVSWLYTIRTGWVLGVLFWQSAQAQNRLSDSLALARAARALTLDVVRYDPAYRVIAYPNGDVPAGTGVCTDVVIRAYRRQNLDLQRLVHEDMKAHFALYPRRWGLRRPDPNIDHRRVPNLMVFFTRKGKSLPCSRRETDYHPGDIVCWDLGNGLTHIGLVGDRQVPSTRRFFVVHNIGAGQVEEDCLLNWTIIGHYRY